MNYSIFRAINKFAGDYQLLDTFMIIISKKARYFYVLCLIFMWFRNSFYKKVTLYAGLSFGVTYVITFLIKLFYFKPRPFLKHKVHLLPPSASKTNSSFPSKHTTLAFALATSVLLYNRFLGWFMWLVAFLSGFSRIWMGQHYPSDILWSALLGSLTALGVNISEQLWKPIINRVLCSYNRFCSLVSNR